VEATKPILPLLKKKVGKKSNWRNNPNSFVQGHASRVIPGGTETFSAGWFAQAHEVCLFLFFWPNLR
jgi:hypothetical protein